MNISCTQEEKNMEKDLQRKKYLYDTERFADLINGTVCQGKQLVAAKDLSDMALR